MKPNPRSSLAAMATLAAAVLAATTTASAQTLTTLKSFTSGFDGGPYVDTGLTLSDGMLYGTGGTIYKIRTDGSDFSVIHQFTGEWFAYGRGRVAVSGDTIYGATSYGGSTVGAPPGDTLGHGIIYRVNTDGTGFTVLREFNKAGGDGYRPAFGLVLSGSTLYGTTTQGGAFDRGVVFKINTNGTGYQNIHSFNYATEGLQPQSELTLIGNTLFGTTRFRSIPKNTFGGMLFKISLDGTGFSVLSTFTDRFHVGSEWINGLTAVGATLYGVGDDYGSGPDFGDPKSSLYKINTDGTGFQVIRQLPPGSRFGNILTWTGSELLGAWHDSSPSGGVFQVNTDGTGYHVIKTFEGNSFHVGDLVFSGTTLYGGRFDFDFGQEPSALFSLDVRPRLAIAAAGAAVKISWPGYAHDYVLEQSPTLAHGSWTYVIEASADDGTNRMTTLPVSPAPGAMFFRLRR